MATVERMLRRALRLIRVLDANEPAASFDTATAIEILNDMMARWEEDGVSVGWVEVDEVSDTVPAPNSAIRAIQYNWAVELAPEYEVEVPQVVGRLAVEGYADLQRDSIKNSIEPRESDHLPSGGNGSFNINTGD
jgi:hypothetical protein